VPLVTKTTDVRIKRDGIVRLESPGGGGFGDPLERDPALVARDVRLGYVSVESARRNYGVALRADGGVDDTATAGLRGNI
jgi:N-methylhydantoinase B